MKWPRGRYNGRKVVGIRITIRIDVLWWAFKVIWISGNKSIHIGPFHFWFDTEYGFLNENKGGLK